MSTEGIRNRESDEVLHHRELADRSQVPSEQNRRTGYWDEWASLFNPRHLACWMEFWDWIWHEKNYTRNLPGKLEDSCLYQIFSELNLCRYFEWTRSRYIITFIMYARNNSQQCCAVTGKWSAKGWGDEAEFLLPLRTWSLFSNCTSWCDVFLLQHLTSDLPKIKKKKVYLLKTCKSSAFYLLSIHSCGLRQWIILKLLLA